MWCVCVCVFVKVLFWSSKVSLAKLPSQASMARTTRTVPKYNMARFLYHISLSLVCVCVCLCVSLTHALSLFTAIGSPHLVAKRKRTVSIVGSGQCVVVAGQDSFALQLCWSRCGEFGRCRQCLGRVRSPTTTSTTQHQDQQENDDDNFPTT